MRTFAVSLGGLEPDYMKKLAVYLSGRLDKTAQVGVVKKPDPDLTDHTDATVWIGSEEFISHLKTLGGGQYGIILTEEPADMCMEPEDSIRICRYQSCERLYQQIMNAIQILRPQSMSATTGARQKWVVMTSDVSSVSLMAFSLTYAQLLGEHASVLYLNLSECSGMETLAGQEEPQDFGDYIMALRQNARPATGAFAGRLEQIDYILPASNPMILHELCKEDIEKLLGAIQSDDRYDSVVIALGNTCCGCEQLVLRADRLIHLSTRGNLQEYSRREWQRFLALCRQKVPLEPEIVDCPQITCEAHGVHLLYEWMEGALGNRVRDLIRTEESDIY